ncbi:MAG: ElyC/SanA/YdcF family protein [Eubacteriales bacterium]
MALVAVIVFIGINLYIMAYSSKYIYDIDDVPKDDYQAVMALGAKVSSSGVLSYGLEDRVEYAVLLYQEGYADKLLFSGDHGRENYDEVNSMMDYSIAMGVPAEDIFLDHAGFDTYDSMVRANKVFECDRIIVVTQSFHIYRAVYIARKKGIDVIGVRSDQTNFVKRVVIKNRVREFLARVKAFIEVEITKPDPVYLGDVIPITGDATLTHDKD